MVGEEMILNTGVLSAVVIVSGYAINAMKQQNESMQETVKGNTAVIQKFIETATICKYVNSKK